jgi:hypothetical protein
MAIFFGPACEVDLEALYFVFKNAIADGNFSILLEEYDNIIERETKIVINGKDSIVNRCDFEGIVDRLREDCLFPVRPNVTLLLDSTPAEVLAIKDGTVLGQPPHDLDIRWHLLLPHLKNVCSCESYNNFGCEL